MTDLFVTPEPEPCPEARPDDRPTTGDSPANDDNNEDTVTYVHPSPKLDPTGLYANAFRKVIPGEETVNMPAERSIPIPRKKPSTARAHARNPAKGNSSAKKPADKALANSTSTSPNDAIKSENISLGQQSADASPSVSSQLHSPSELSLSDQGRSHPPTFPNESQNYHSSERPIFVRRAALPSSYVRPPQSSEMSPVMMAQDLSVVNVMRAESEDRPTTRYASGVSDKPVSEYRRRPNQAALRMARYSDNGSPAERQSFSREPRPAVRDMLPPSTQESIETSPIMNGPQRVMASTSGREQSFEVHSPDPVTPHHQQPNATPANNDFTSPHDMPEHSPSLNGSNKRRRPRSPPPSFDGFPSPHYSGKYSPEEFSERTQSGRLSHYALGDDGHRANQALVLRRPASPEYGFYDDDNNWIRTPQNPRRRMNEEMEGHVFVDDDENDDDLFVSPRHSLGHSAKKPRHGERPFSSEDWAQSEHRRQPEFSTDPNPGYFNVPGGERRSSRYSGAEMPWGLNQDPVMVDQSKIYDASLKKRNLTRGIGDKDCPRAYGANDPENIRIVNLKEINGFPFTKIADILNEQRIKEGRKPSMTGCGVTSRYNRTAPLLFAAQGKEFVPLSQRRGKGKRGGAHGTPTGKIVWTPQLDMLLVEKVKEFESTRWTTVAQIMEEITGRHFDPESVAKRHTML